MRPVTALFVASVGLVGCSRSHTRATASLDPAPTQPRAPKLPPPTAKEEPAAPAIATPSGLIADDAPWLALQEHFVKTFSEMSWTPYEDVTTDKQMREAVCSDGSGEPWPCEGRGPWLVRAATDDGEWGFALADYRRGAWLLSEAFGTGGLARCGAATEAALIPTRGGVRVKVDDYLEFPEYECVDEDSDDSEDPDDCEQMMGSCGTPVQADCTMSFDPISLAVTHVEGECNAYDAGAELGLDF